MSFDESACINCGSCSKICKMNVDPIKNPNSTECIRCGDCVKACPKGALKLTGSSFKWNNTKAKGGTLN